MLTFAATTSMSAARAPAKGRVENQPSARVRTYTHSHVRPDGFDMDIVNAYCSSFGPMTCRPYVNYNGDWGSLLDQLCDYSCFDQQQGSPNFDVLNAGFCSMKTLPKVGKLAVCSVICA